MTQLGTMMPHKEREASIPSFENDAQQAECLRAHLDATCYATRIADRLASHSTGDLENMKYLAHRLILLGPITLTLVAYLLPSLAHAHVGVGESVGFARGVRHPLGGIDHILAMVAVGLWAAQCGGRALWFIPVTFVLVMGLGAFVSTLDIAVPFVEQGIVLSVLVLGVLVAADPTARATRTPPFTQSEARRVQ